jgi:hypothetical protein
MFRCKKSSRSSEWIADISFSQGQGMATNRKVFISGNTTGAIRNLISTKKGLCDLSQRPAVIVREPGYNAPLRNRFPD